MSEVIADLELRVVEPDGREFFVNVAAEPTEDGRWAAWLEFVPLDDTEPLLTDTESIQPTREAVTHWASTLGDVFVEGAFSRATAAAEFGVRRTVATPTHRLAALDSPAALDPFEFVRLGENALRSALRPLTHEELLTVIRDFDLNPAQLSLARLTTTQLVTFIVTATKVQALQRG
jgi:hypothetical protein